MEIEIERQSGVKLPEDYIHWVRQYAAPKDCNTYILMNGEHYHFDAYYPPETIVYEMEDLYYQEEEFKLMEH